MIGAPYDATSSFGKGADRGPAAIRACLDRQIEFYDRLSGLSPANGLKIAYVETQLAGLSPERMVHVLEEEYRRHEGKFRMILGGEHSVTNAALRYFAPLGREVTVVQIDAHADLRESDADYSDNPAGRYAHCAVMRRAFEAGYRLVQVGIRAYSEEERALFQEESIRVFEWSQHPASILEIMAAIPTVEVYLTIDADGLDPAHMPATGTPVPGGLDWHFCNEFIRRLCAEKEIIGADIVEVAPREGDVLTEYAAAQLCYSIIGCCCRAA